MIQVLPFLNSPEDLDPLYYTDLDFWDCFGKKKLSYKQRNMVDLGLCCHRLMTSPICVFSLQVGVRKTVPEFY